MASTTFPTTTARTRRWRWRELKHSVNWLYLVPALLFFLGYQLYPLLHVFYISFTDYFYLRQEPAPFIGLQNYAEALADPIFLFGLVRAAIFTAIFLPGVIFFSL